MTNVNLIPNGLRLRVWEPINCEFSTELDIRQYGKYHRKLNKFILTKWRDLIEDEDEPGTYQVYELDWPTINRYFPTMTLRYSVAGVGGGRFFKKISFLDLLLGELAGRLYFETALVETCRDIYFKTALSVGHSIVNHYITGLWLNLESGELFLCVDPK